jgi:hypothetical protein
MKSLRTLTKAPIVAILAITAMVLTTLLMPAASLGASTLYIDITATGAEVTISCNCTAWAVGTVIANDDILTSYSYCNVTNSTSQAVEITIHGNEMKDAATGAVKTWTLDSTATAGAATIGMKAGVNDTTDNMQTIIREHDDGSFAKLTFDTDTTLAASDSWLFGMEFLAPTSSLGNEAMIMCDDAGSHTNDADNGVTLIAATP